MTEYGNNIGEQYNQILFIVKIYYLLAGDVNILHVIG